MTFRSNPPMRRRLAVGIITAISLASAAGCSSDDADDGDPSIDEEPAVPIDPSVDDGVDTNVEAPGNLGFDEEPATVDEVDD